MVLAIGEPAGEGASREPGVAQHDHPLDDVLQLPDIAGIAVALEPLHGLGRQREAVSLIEPGVALDEVLGQERDLLGALAQRRHLDLDHVEAVVEILAEAPGGHGLLDVLVGGGQHAHVHLDGVAAAHAGELPVLEHVQELALERRVEIADLVEEDRAVVGGLELAHLEGMGPREGPALVAEELGFEQLARHRGAVDLDVGPRLAGRVVVDGAGHQVLAGSRLARDEDGDVHAGGLVDDLPRLLHPGAAPEVQLLREPRPGLLLGGPPPGAPRARQRALDGVLQLLRREGLLDEVVGPERRGLGRALHAVAAIAVGQQDDGPGVAALYPEPAQQLGPVGAVEIEVEEAEEELVVGQRRQRLVHAAGEDWLVAPLGQQAREVALRDGIGLHHEDEARPHGLVGPGRGLGGRRRGPGVGDGRHGSSLRDGRQLRLVL